MSFLPPSADTGAMALLSMISDPEAYRAKLQEITTANAELYKSIAESRNLHQQVTTIQREIQEQRRLLDTERTELETITTHTRKSLENERRVIEQQRAEANSLAVQVRDSEARSAEIEKQLNIRATDLDSRSRGIAQREAVLSQQETSFRERLQDYDDRVRQLKDIIQR